jgi:hypothetical protein
MVAKVRPSGDFAALTEISDTPGDSHHGYPRRPQDHLLSFEGGASSDSSLLSRAVRVVDAARYLVITEPQQVGKRAAHVSVEGLTKSVSWRNLYILDSPQTPYLLLLTSQTEKKSYTAFSVLKVRLRRFMS